MHLSIIFNKPLHFSSLLPVIAFFVVRFPGCFLLLFRGFFCLQINVISTLLALYFYSSWDFLPLDLKKINKPLQSYIYTPVFADWGLCLTLVLKMFIVLI